MKASELITELLNQVKEGNDFEVFVPDPGNGHDIPDPNSVMIVTEVKVCEPSVYSSGTSKIVLC